MQVLPDLTATSSLTGTTASPHVLVRPARTVVIRSLPEQVFVPQRRMENSIHTGVMVAKHGAIEVLAQPRHKGPEHRRAVEVNPLPIDSIMRSLASLEKLRTPIEIRTLSEYRRLLQNQC